jgi:hypothetical protein
MLILFLLYYWPFCGSALVLVCVSEKATKKNYSITFRTVMDVLNNDSKHKFGVDSRYEFFSFVRESVQNYLSSWSLQN